MSDVALDVRITRRMSVGTRAYVHELRDRLPRVAGDLNVAFVGRGENFTLDEQIGLPRAIVRSGARAVHYPTTFAPLARSQPYAVTIHDLIHLRYPALFGRATALHYALVGGPLARGAMRLCMGDARTIDDCERLLGVKADRCRVVPLGYDPALLDVEAPFRTERPFLLYVGNHRPHKNLDALYGAWAALPAEIELDLSVTGPVDTRALAMYQRSNGTLRFMGELSRFELRQQYRAALGYVHPALLEGFGIPMLEAAVVGTPVLASTSAVPACVAPFAELFDPHDLTSLGHLIERLLRDPVAFRARVSEGAATLRAYTWDRFAAATAAVYREVLGC